MMQNGCINCQLLFSALFFIFRKSISNGVQMQRNFLEIFFGPEDIQRAEEVPERGPEVGSTHHGVPGGPGAPWWVVPSSAASRTASSPYKFSNIPKPFVVTLDEKFRCRKPLYPRETNRGPFSVICRRGESSPEAIIIIIPEVSMTRRE
jgi:hypothetical protein